VGSKTFVDMFSRLFSIGTLTHLIIQQNTYQFNSSYHSTEPLNSDIRNFLTTKAGSIPPAILLNTPEVGEWKTTASGYARHDVTPATL
jgi:hypothetical protein